MKIEVDVAPEVLVWAKNRARLSEEALQKNYPKFYDWTAGRGKPTLAKLESLAKKANVPFGYLLLPAPPAEKLSLPDFRTPKDQGVSEPSPELLDTIRLLTFRQDWMREHLVEVGSGPLPFVGSESICSNPAKVAAAMRKAMSLEAGWTELVQSWDQALGFLLSRCEAIGICYSVNGVVANNTSRALDPNEFRGFVLVDEYAPFLFINGADAKSAKMFTLAHELAHIWVGQSSVFDIPELQSGQNQTEKFCNRVAAEFLVPADQMQLEWDRFQGRSDRLDRMASRLKVSALVIARRAYDLGLIGSSEYSNFYRQRMANEFRKDGDSGGGNFFSIQKYRIGTRFPTEVIRAARAGALLYRDAYKLLSLESKTVDSYAAKVLEL